ncbi:MAG: transketolase [Clostridiales bacterium]|jgi:transketolase|nr:transketolase [Clostridiales bacterium]
MTNIDNLCINTIRLLSADAVQAANSGHPGLPLGAAPMAYTAWARHMAHNPKNSAWRNRDRFVLSAGHGSTLLYSLLHVFGYKLSLDDLRRFRKTGSATAGHPEYDHTDGVEITTGPLGQGIANAVGMAWAENYLAANFNKPNFPVVDHYTYVLCGDGCLQEGVASEAASLAGTLKLGKLILLYDSNNITIEGNTEISFTEDVLKRHAAYGWHVQKVDDGNDVGAISAAIQAAKDATRAPSIIEIKTQIGFGSPGKQGKASAHGEPLGVDELAATKKNLGFNPEEFFHVPDEVKKKMQELQKENQKKEDDWNKLVDGYKKAHPEDFARMEVWYSGNLPNFLADKDFWTYEGNIATRVSSEKVLNKVAALVPNLFGGAADLAPSTKTIMAGRGSYSAANPTGANLHFGVREHAMSAIANGMAVHGGLRPYVAGFFVFSDYAKPALRLAAMMGLPVISIFTHDSIGVGEDGPTHQPIEHLAALRSIPNFTVIRPCDTNETAAAWTAAMTRKNSPTAIVLTRQNTQLLAETGKGALKGAYILKDSEGGSAPDIILMATGSEVELIYNAHAELKKQGINARVVSMPSWEIFEEQSEEYKQSVLPKGITKRLAVEAASPFGWARYVGPDGGIIAIDGFGKSGPAAELFAEFGFTVENVAARAIEIIQA